MAWSTGLVHAAAVSKARLVPHALARSRPGPEMVPSLHADIVRHKSMSGSKSAEQGSETERGPVDKWLVDSARR